VQQVLEKLAHRKASGRNSIWELTGSKPMPRNLGTSVSQQNLALCVATGYNSLPRRRHGQVTAACRLKDNHLMASIRHNRTVRAALLRGAFTLIEMLVAMAITLIMMGGVISMFGVVSEGIKDSRATMEMTERVTAVRSRLQTDLKGCTAEAKPPLRPEDSMGYFEYIEGIANDWTYTNFQLPTGAAIPLPPGATIPPPTVSLMGDTDDILMFTSRSRNEPFTGRGLQGPGAAPTPAAVQSQVAEIIWFAVPNGIVLDPSTDDPLVGPSGSNTGTRLRTVYRRVMLVAPQLQPYVDAMRVAGDARVGDLLTFQRYFDLSARWDASAMGGAGNVVLNTLSDVTKRENRFAHYIPTGPMPVPGTNVTAAIRPAIVNAPFDDNVTGDGRYTAGSNPEVFMAFTGSNASYPPVADPTRWAPVASLFHSNLCPLQDFAGNARLPALYRQGEDVIASNVLAFDVRAYDPGAPQLLSGSTVIGPCDAGYATAGGTSVVSYGGFVDLGYLSTLTAPAIEPWFSSYHAAFVIQKQYVPPFTSPFNSRAIGGAVGKGGLYIDSSDFTLAFPMVYDTWSLHYEADGITQGGGRPTVDAIDAASNGIDDDGANGVDDAGERETSPPFPHPMRGIMVKIREYDVSTRSTKEVSILHDFMPE
jgi:prepilin-type N-terminal cleavage/methylation domain-containing protein